MASQQGEECVFGLAMASTETDSKQLCFIFKEILFVSVATLLWQ
jgi:hypothetical protein